MPKITGYARRPESRWPLIAGILLSLFLLIIVIILLSPTEKSLQESTEPKPQLKEEKQKAQTVITGEVEIMATGEAATSSDIKVEKIQFTSEIDESNQPVDELSRVSLKEHNTVYGYTKILSGTVPQAIKHVWLDPSGKVFASIDLNITGKVQDTWSYISLSGARTGRWELQVKKINGEIIAKANFSTY